MKRIVIADDQRILREGLKALLTGADSFEVVAEADSSMEVIRCVEEHQPDLLLLNLSLLFRGGRSVIQKIKNRFPATKILAFGPYASEESMIEGLQLGADGYCLKDCGRTELMTAIDRVLAGETYLSPDIAERLMDGIVHGQRGRKRLSPFGSLTLREKQVLALVGQGYQTKKIAQHLLISPKTVEKHRSNIARKLDIHNASRLTLYAIEKGLVPARSQGGRLV